MAYNSSLQPLEDICTRINKLEPVLAGLDTELKSFVEISAHIEEITVPLPSNMLNDLNIFYSGLQEVDDMIKELDQITLEKLKSILEGASNDIETLISPIPEIISDMKSITSLFPDVQSEISRLHDPSKGVEASIKPLNSKLASWSNTTPQDSGNNTGTGVLNAIHSELKRAIDDNKTLKNKYDKEIKSIVAQINGLAEKLDNPVSTLSNHGENLDKLLQDVNDHLNQYYSALTSTNNLSKKTDKVISLLDKFKPDVDLVYGIVKPLGWFIELVESKTGKQTVRADFDGMVRENRLNFYSDEDISPESKFQLFKQTIYGYFQENNIGEKIQEVVQNFLPINELKKAADSLNSDLKTLDANSSVSKLMSTFSDIATEIKNVENELKKLHTDAKRASGTVTFERTHPNEDAKLNKGTFVQGTTGDIVFVTMEDAIFNKGDFNSKAVKAQAQAVGTDGNVTANVITKFVSTPVKQADKSYKNQPNPVYDDTFSVSASTAFTGGTDLSVNQIQGEANALANKMLPTLTRLGEI